MSLPLMLIAKLFMLTKRLFTSPNLTTLNCVLIHGAYIDISKHSKYFLVILSISNTYSEVTIRLNADIIASYICLSFF